MEWNFFYLLNYISTVNKKYKSNKITAFKMLLNAVLMTRLKIHASLVHAISAVRLIWHQKSKQILDEYDCRYISDYN